MHCHSRNSGWFTLTSTADLAGNRQKVVFLGCPFDPDPSAPPHCDAGDRLEARMTYDPATRAEAGQTGLWHADKASAELESRKIRRVRAFENGQWLAPPCGKGKVLARLEFGLRAALERLRSGFSAKPGRMRVGQS
jgi:hypothetical protein